MKDFYLYRWKLVGVLAPVNFVGLPLLDCLEAARRGAERYWFGTMQLELD